MKPPISLGDARSWRILGVLFAGVFMGALDIAIVGPALPALQDEFALDSRALSWVFNLYILFSLLGAPLMAKLSDRYGRRSVYLADIALFALGSILVAVAPSFPVLLAGRAVQAFGAGGFLPVASAVIGDTFLPARRGPALGLIGAVFGLAFLLGPLFGGVLLQFNWRWLFLINLPVAGVVIWQAAMVLPGDRDPDRRPFDALGAGLLCIALACVAWTVSELDTSALVGSLTSARVLPLIVLAFVTAVLFWKTENRAEDPVLHPDLLRSRELRLVGCIAAGTGLAEAGMVFLPALAVTALGVEDFTASFMLVPLVLSIIIGGPLAGFLLSLRGARQVIQAGLFLVVCGLLVFGLPALSIETFYLGGSLVGLGLSALLGAPLRFVVIRETPKAQRGAGQGLLTLCLSIGRIAGAAALGGFAASGQGAAAGYRTALVTVSVLIALLILLSFRLKRDHPATAREIG